MACKPHALLQLDHISRLIDEAEALANEWVSPPCPFSPTRVNSPEFEQYQGQGPAFPGSPGELMRFDDSDPRAPVRDTVQQDNDASKSRKRWARQEQTRRKQLPKWCQEQPEVTEPEFEECPPTTQSQWLADFLVTHEQSTAPWPQPQEPAGFHEPESRKTRKRWEKPRQPIVLQQYPPAKEESCALQRARKRWATAASATHQPMSVPKWSQVKPKTPTVYPVCEEYTCPEHDQLISTPWDHDPQAATGSRPGRATPETSTRLRPTSQRSRAQVQRVQQTRTPQASSRPTSHRPAPYPARDRIAVEDRPRTRRRLFDQDQPTLPTAKSVEQALSRRPRSRTPGLAPPLPPPNSPTCPDAPPDWAQNYSWSLGGIISEVAEQEKPSTSPDSGLGSYTSRAGSPPTEIIQQNLGSEVANIILETRARLDCAFRNAYGQSLDDIVNSCT